MKILQLREEIEDNNFSKLRHESRDLSKREKSSTSQVKRVCTYTWDNLSEDDVWIFKIKEEGSGELSQDKCEEGLRNAESLYV